MNDEVSPVPDDASAGVSTAVIFELPAKNEVSHVSTNSDCESG
jgi:hypothetical protein